MCIKQMADWFTLDYTSSVRVNMVPLAYFIVSIKTHNYNKLCK